MAAVPSCSVYRPAPVRLEMTSSLPSTTCLILIPCECSIRATDDHFYVTVGALVVDVQVEVDIAATQRLHHGLGSHSTSASL